MSCGYRLALACSKPAEQVIYHTRPVLRLLGQRRRLLDEIFPWLCDGSGRNLLKSDIHAHCLVITQRKLAPLKPTEVEDVIGLGQAGPPNDSLRSVFWHV